MKPSDILFVAGNVDRLASIKIRGREIATRLGCDFFPHATSIASIPSGYQAYVCIKPDFDRRELPDLAKKGKVIWDILDDTPPTDGVDAYIASTKYVRNMFSHFKQPIAVIPHYHCNFTGELNNGLTRTAAYVGSDHWYPELNGLEHKIYFVHRWEREELIPVYMNIGISLNLRSLTIRGESWVTSSTDIKPEATKHIMLNSGMKLINSIGFGIPSVCSVEPAYLEIAPECTLFTDQHACGYHVGELARNDALYARIRAKCILAAKQYSVQAVTEIYRDELARI